MSWGAKLNLYNINSSDIAVRKIRDYNYYELAKVGLAIGPEDTELDRR